MRRLVERKMSLRVLPRPAERLHVIGRRQLKHAVRLVQRQHLRGGWPAANSIPSDRSASLAFRRHCEKSAKA